MPKKGEGLIDATSFYFPDSAAKVPNKGSVDFSQKVSASGDADLMGVPFDSKPKASNASDSFVQKPSAGGKFAGRGDSERSSSKYE